MAIKGLNSVLDYLLHLLISEKYTIYFIFHLVWKLYQFNSVDIWKVFT